MTYSLYWHIAALFKKLEIAITLLHFRNKINPGFPLVLFQFFHNSIDFLPVIDPYVNHENFVSVIVKRI